MTRLGWTSAVLLATGIAAGTLADRPATTTPLRLGGYRVLAGDFHTHSSTWSDGALTPWGLVLQAQREALDVIAVTGHNELLDGEISRWYARRIGGPIVLVGQEIIGPDHHVIGVGLTRLVNWRLPVAEQAAEVHRQGGVAIAAHPFSAISPYVSDEDVASLDGAEICHPASDIVPGGQRRLEAFAARAALAAIGSSDYHGFGRMGRCRTYVFVRDATAEGVLDALRAHRTVVYDFDGRAYGDPSLVALAETVPRLRAQAIAEPYTGALDWLSRVAAWSGLVILAVVALRPPRRRSRASLR